MKEGTAAPVPAPAAVVVLLELPPPLVGGVYIGSGGEMALIPLPPTAKATASAKCVSLKPSIDPPPPPTRAVSFKVYTSVAVAAMDTMGWGFKDAAHRALRRPWERSRERAWARNPVRSEAPERAAKEVVVVGGEGKGSKPGEAPPT